MVGEKKKAPEAPIEKPRQISIRRAAQLYGFSRRAFWYWIKNPNPAYDGLRELVQRRPGNGQVMLPVDELEAWLGSVGRRRKPGAQS